MQLQLHRVVADIGKGQAALAVEAQYPAPRFSSARESLSVQMLSLLVSGRFRSGHPVIGAAWLNGNGSGHVLQARNPAGRIVFRRSHSE